MAGRDKKHYATGPEQEDAHKPRSEAGGAVVAIVEAIPSVTVGDPFHESSSRYD